MIAFPFVWILIGLSWSWPADIEAHEFRPAFLEMREIKPDSYSVRWKVPAKGEMRLGIYARLPQNCRSGPKQTMFQEGALVETWSAECQGGLADKAISVEGLNATLTDVLVRLENLEGRGKTFRLTPDRPEAVAGLDGGERSLPQVARTYFFLGIEHILLGFDHLLFLLALLMIVKGWRQMAGTVTAFTAGHSFTLAAATLGWVRIPPPPVEAAIALSIAFVASEVIQSRRGKPSLAARRPWIVAILFGLLHGLGFAGALSEIGLPRGDIPMALMMFNLGVEAGQLGFIMGVFGCAALLKRLRMRLPPWVESLPPYAIGSLAMFWVFQRISGF